MLQPSNTLSSIVEQTGLQQLAKAIAIDTSPKCETHRSTPTHCAQLQAAHQRQQILADCIAVGFALFVAVVVGRVAVRFVELFGTYLKHHQARIKVRTAAAQRRSEGGLLDG
ncbi:hypothetical protein [Pseudomonas sp.]|uniref:hypothetical protein n=1 Tax=Pseudomonas sp. TaxID=306 RepID=UPI003D0AB64E